MDKCTDCKTSIAGYESISVKDHGTFCYRCFNSRAAAWSGVDAEQIHLDGIVLKDADQRSHTFRVVLVDFLKTL